jgi:hypothetical protein
VYSGAVRKAGYSSGPRPLAALVWFPVVKLPLQDEWVPAPQAEKASRRQERLRVPALAASERFSGLWAQQREKSPGELLELPVSQRGQRALPEQLASRRQAPREPAAAPPELERLASSAPPSLQPPSLPSQLWRPLPPGLLPPRHLGSSYEPFLQRRRELSSNASFFP